MSKDLPHIIFSPQRSIEETFAAYHYTHQFYQEIQARADFQQYCEWNYTTAERHRQELERMRGELNIFQWFRRR